MQTRKSARVVPPLPSAVLGEEVSQTHSGEAPLPPSASVSPGEEWVPTGKSGGGVPPLLPVPLAEESRPKHSGGTPLPLLTSASPREEARPTGRSEQTYTPLVVAKSSAPAPTGLVPMRPAIPTPLGVEKKQDKGSPSQRPEPSVREPDEIQIHIGRIEVTAMPPAAPRAAAANPRRGAPSLDEYLRRRDRRVS
jgi:hypothetical protein